MGVNVRVELKSFDEVVGVEGLAHEEDGHRDNLLVRFPIYGLIGNGTAGSESETVSRCCVPSGYSCHGGLKRNEACNIGSQGLIDNQSREERSQARVERNLIQSDEKRPFNIQSGGFPARRGW